MKNYAFLALAVSMLAGCGGGSDTNSDGSPTTPKNNLPSLSGEFVLTGKANVSFSGSFNAKDLDGDALTVSFEDQPDWLEYTFSGNELTLSGEPKLIDVDTYTTKVILSDGKQSQNYSLNINIADDPSAWQPLPITAEELAGAWQSEEHNVAFIVAEDVSTSSANIGYLIEGDKKYMVNYQLSDGINLGLLDEYDYSTVEDTRQFEVIAKSDTKLRLVANVNDQKKAFNFSPVNKAITESFSFTPTFSNDTWFSGGHIDLDSNEQSNIHVAVALPRLSHLAHSSYDYNVSVTASYNSETAEFTPISPVTTSYCWRIENPFTFDCPNLSVKFSKIKVLGVFNDTLFYSVTHHYEADLSETQKRALPLLANFLDQQYTSVYAEKFKKIEKIARPSIEVGQTYTGRILLRDPDTHVELNGTYYHSGSGTFTLTSENTGSFTIELADHSAQETKEFTYELTETSINIFYDGKTTQRHFYKLPNGLTGITEPYADQYESKFDIRPFVAVQELSMEDSMGTFISTGSSTSSYNLGYDKVTIRYAENSETVLPSRWEQDDSVTFVDGCHHYNTIAECEQMAQDNEDHIPLYYRNLKLLYADGDYYLFQDSFNSEGDAFQSYRSFRKVN